MCSCENCGYSGGFQLSLGDSFQNPFRLFETAKLVQLGFEASEPLEADKFVEPAPIGGTGLDVSADAESGG